MYSSGATDDEDEEGAIKPLPSYEKKEQDLATTTSRDLLKASTSLPEAFVQESSTAEPTHVPRPEWTEEKSDITDGQGLMRCDGVCPTGSYSLGGMYMCRFDGQVFCNECFKLPEGHSWHGSLYSGAKCSPSHELFHFPPVATQCEEDELLLDGKVMKKREWTARIRKDFGILEQEVGHSRR
jgi:hypothetical protein